MMNMKVFGIFISIYVTQYNSWALNASLSTEKQVNSILSLHIYDFTILWSKRHTMEMSPDAPTLPARLSTGNGKCDCVFVLVYSDPLAGNMKNMLFIWRIGTRSKWTLNLFFWRHFYAIQTTCVDLLITKYKSTMSTKWKKDIIITLPIHCNKWILL